MPTPRPTRSTPDADPARPPAQSGRRVLIAAHGNSLRALVKYLDNVSEEDIVGLNIPTGAAAAAGSGGGWQPGVHRLARAGIPLVYELDRDLKPIRHYYLGDADAAAAKAAAVAAQASSK